MRGLSDQNIGSDMEDKCLIMTRTVSGCGPFGLLSAGLWFQTGSFVVQKEGDLFWNRFCVCSVINSFRISAEGNFQTTCICSHVHPLKLIQNRSPSEPDSQQSWFHTELLEMSGP